MKKTIKRIFKALLIVFLIITGFCIFVFAKMTWYEKNYIKNIEDLPNDCDAILVLGAGLKSDNTPSDILTDRLITALKIAEENKCEKFILSGDHGDKSYNEVGAMKKFLMDKGIPENNIFMDHAGFNTYESMYRAKEIFEADKLIIVTNEYHLPRSLYISRNLDIESYGVSSDIRNYWFMTKYKIREALAQVKDYINIHIFKPEPTFLGEPIPVNSSDGRLTND